MNYKLISTDLDGTLLDSHESISPENTKIMKKLSDAGIIIAVNTGRTLFEMPQPVREHPYIDYFICSNGAVIYNKEKKIVYKEYLSRQSFKTVFDMLLGYDTSFAIHENGISVLDKNKATVEFWTDHRASEYAARNFVNFSDVEENFVSRYSKPSDVEMICCYFKYADELTECISRLQDVPSVKIAASSNENIEVFSDGANKGLTLAALCNIVGVSLDETIAVGDSPNDITMLERAGLAVAVSNAMEPVKAKSDVVICSNNEPIMKDLEKYI